jgi:16S rRNA (cytidine1402-2'-O)-methyltransferase
MAGTLFVVGTPIGNLEDLTFRALRILKEVHVVAAEDTRRTSRLLAHYRIRKPLVSVREHNEARETARIIQRLGRGESVALATDAGTPGIADPGSRVVNAVRAAGFPVVPIPGASAVSTAISVSGMPTDEFVFMGFPPRAPAARERWMSRLAADPRVIVIFESPHRTARTLDDLTSLLVNRQIIVFRELTKINEMSVIWENNSQLSHIPHVGEFTIVVGPDAGNQLAVSDPSIAFDLFGRLTNFAGISEQDAIAAISGILKSPEGVVRKAIKKEAISVKQRIGPAP